MPRLTRRDRPMLKTWLTRALVLGWIPTLFVAGGVRA